MEWRGVKVVLAAAAVAGAIVLSEVAVRPPRAQNQRVKITYWEKWTDFEGAAMKAVVDEFNKSQNRIFVEILTVSNIGDKTLMAIAGGVPPDVAGLFGTNLAQYADANAVIPLDDYCSKAGISRDDYIPVYWDLGYYRGHVYALPSTPASTALHYNKGLFAKAGLNPDNPPETIEELVDVADKLVRKEGGTISQFGFLPAEPGWWNWGWGYIFGGRLWDGQGKITANAPENVRAYEWVQSFYRKYGKTELQTFRSGFGNFSSPQNAFIDEKVAMVLQGVWMYNFIDKFAKEGFEWGAAPFPYPAERPEMKGVTFADMDILVIPRGAKHPDEAFEFIRFVQSQKGMEMLCLGQRKHSPLSKVSKEFLAQHPNPYIELFTDLPKLSSVRHYAQIGIWPEYSQELNTAFEEIVTTDKSPKEALDYVTNRMQPKLDQYLDRLRAREGGDTR